MEVYTINTIEEFHQYYPYLKDSARTGSVPDTFLVGFDLEFICRDNQPESFEKASQWLESTDFNFATCLVQIATNTICLVINLVEMKKPIPKNLLKIFKNSCWVKVGVGIDNDLSILSKNYLLEHCEGGIELKNLALIAGATSPNLESLYNRVFGEHVKKGSSICDWSQDLTEEQLSYAAKDAIMSFQLGDAILRPSFEFINKSVLKKSSRLEINFVNDNGKKGEIKDPTRINYIGRLNELGQKKSLELPKYEQVDRPLDNNCTFQFKCSFSGFEAIGSGHSKKEAKQNSAKEVYQFVL